MPRRVVEAFLNKAGGSPLPPPELEATLETLIRTAHAAWPGVNASHEDFAALLGSHAAGPPPRALADLPAADLWLALGCARGDAAALRAFEARTFPGARAALGRMGLSPDAIDEALQALRERLLIAEPGKDAKILSAAGHGDLNGVVRIAAVRTALNLRRRDHRVEAADAPLFDALAARDDDPELAALKSRERIAFKAAIEDALASLEAEERNLLRLHLVHRLSIDEIGRAYHIHRATAARRLSSVREKLDRETRRLLAKRLGLSDAELASLFGIVESQLEVSFRRLLATSPGGRESA